MIRIGVIGAGAHSQGHGRSLQLLNEKFPGRIELAAVCDLDTDRRSLYQSDFDFSKQYDNIQAMLENEKLDGIMAIVPIPLTEKIVTGLLPLGIPILIEKPAGENSETARRLLAAVRQHECPHMLSLNRRFSPALTRAEDWIQDNRNSEEPSFMLSRILRHNRLESEFATGTGIHLVDIILSVMGIPSEITTIKSLSASKRRHHYYSSLFFEDGRLAQSVIAPDAGILEETHEIHYSQCRVKIDMLGCTVSIAEKGKPVFSWHADENAELVFRDGTFEETIAFVELAEGKPGIDLPDLAQCSESMAATEAIIDS